MTSIPLTSCGQWALYLRLSGLLGTFPTFVSCFLSSCSSRWSGPSRCPPKISSTSRNWPTSQSWISITTQVLDQAGAPRSPCHHVYPCFLKYGPTPASFCFLWSQGTYKQRQNILTSEWTFPHRSVEFISGLSSQREGVLNTFILVKVILVLKVKYQISAISYHTQHTVELSYAEVAAEGKFWLHPGAKGLKELFANYSTSLA